MPGVNFKTHNSFYKKTPSVRRVFFLSVCTPAGFLYTQKVGLPQGVCTLRKSLEPAGCMYTQNAGCLPQGAFTLQKPQGKSSVPETQSALIP